MDENVFSAKALSMMKKMGYEEGKGLGKDLQGAAETLNIQSNQKNAGIAYQPPTKNGLYSCRGCNKVFNHITQVRTHSTTKQHQKYLQTMPPHQMVEFECTYCEIGLACLQTAILHDIKAEHNKITHQNGKFKCDICDVTANSQSQWTQHLNGTQHMDKISKLGIQQDPGTDTQFDGMPSHPDSQEFTSPDSSQTIPPYMSQPPTSTHEYSSHPFDDPSSQPLSTMQSFTSTPYDTSSSQPLPTMQSSFSYTPYDGPSSQPLPYTHRQVETFSTHDDNGNDGTLNHDHVNKKIKTEQFVQTPSTMPLPSPPLPPSSAPNIINYPALNSLYNSPGPLSVDAKFGCGVCNVPCNSQAQLHAHLISKGHLNKMAPQNFHCSVCNQTFNSQAQLTSHFSGKKHLDQMAKGPVYENVQQFRPELTCQVCFLVFNSISQKQMHEAGEPHRRKAAYAGY